MPYASVASGKSADIITEVIDANGKTILSSTQKMPLAGETVPIILGIDIDGLATDSYRLRVRATFDGADQAEAEKPFFYSSGIQLSEAPPEQTISTAGNDSLILAGSDFVRMSEAEMDEVIAQSMYWGTELDQKAVKKLKSLAEKQSFLFTFWRGQDQTHQSAQPLDAYRIFKSRVEEANKKYAHLRTPGWKTSLGRIFITYGKAKTITDKSFEVGYKPYITWVYEPDHAIRLSTGNYAEFDFVDRDGGGSYSLVSANVIGEPYDPNWKMNEAYRISH